MKINRNYHFVLTVLDNEKINAGEIRIDSCAVTGERMFASECHYYAEKNILECLKEADKRNDLSIAFGLTTSRNKSIKCESFTICCRLNLSGLQENKLMNMQQEWA